MPGILHIAGCAGGPRYCRRRGWCSSPAVCSRRALDARVGGMLSGSPEALRSRAPRWAYGRGTDRAGDKDSAQLPEP
jgi:hypothetical protein